MKIKIVKGNGACTPCESLIDTIEILAKKEPELNLSYEVLVKGTSDGDRIMKEHGERGFSELGRPLWILYDDAGTYIETFLGFPLPDYEHKLKELKESILLKDLKMKHPTHKIWEKN
jgi:hypothetical protein